MPMVRAMRLLNAIEAGTLTGAQLEILLTADTGRLAELNALLYMRGQVRRMLASTTAMTAIAGSSAAMNAVSANSVALNLLLANSAAMAVVAASTTAMNAVIANSAALNSLLANSAAMAVVAASTTAMNAIIASSTALNAVTSSATAMNALWASNSATDAIFASAASRLAVYNSDAALSVLQANPTQVQRKVSSGAVNASTSNPSFVFVANGTKVILLRRYYSFSDSDMISWTRGSTVAAVGLGPSGGGRNIDTGTQALGCISGSYTSSGAAPITNDASANFVSAANGLQRRNWSSGATLYVSYIMV